MSEQEDTGLTGIDAEIAEEQEQASEEEVEQEESAASSIVTGKQR